jgi:NEDD8-activating enzyme E1 regulatory subunit
LHIAKEVTILAETMATNDKYDRQLRLWGSHGQKALMDAHLLLITADGSGTETLKNLFLPGVGRFTIVSTLEQSKRNRHTPE